MKTWVTGSQWCAFYRLPLPALCFTGIQGYSNNDQRKLEADARSNKDQNDDLVPQMLHTTIMCNYDLKYLENQNHYWFWKTQLLSKQPLSARWLSLSWTSLTWWANQSSLNLGRNFMWTTANCISSKVGCDPTSSSNGNLYSSMGPGDRNTLIGIASGSAL